MFLQGDRKSPGMQIFMGYMGVLLLEMLIVKIRCDIIMTDKATNGPKSVSLLCE